MKRALIILISMLFVVMSVGIAFAAETTFNGEYKVRAWSNSNFDKRPDHPDSEKGLYTGYFDQRFRLTITHTTSEFLKAVVQVDLVEDTWGQQRNFLINNNTNGEFVRKAYLEFALPRVGTFTVGKQPVVFGYGLMFSDTSGYLDGLKWSNTWGPVGVSALYFKFNDGVRLGGTSEYYNRDTDIWALDLMITPNDKHTIELFGGYVNARTGYPMSHEESFWFDHSGFDFDKVHSHIGFLGIAYTGEIADMLTLKGGFSYLSGRADLSNWGESDHAWLSGYNVYVDASWHNDLLRAGLAFVHGSGQTNSGWDAEHYNTNFITADEFVFGNIIASGNGGLNDAFGTGLGFADDIENLTAAKLYFEVSPMEKLSLNGAVIWARWTEPVGTYSYYYHPVNYYLGNNTYNSWYTDSTDLGWEIDLGLSYEIMEGLTYSLTTGVLFTGDSFDYEGAGGTHENWGPIWTVNNNLIYEF
ncbi:MAG: hypothetical protein JW765_11450 [Deltaproteobacteria bacterium]|nr:hypothetical protein [Candidatus Zymogenaceae bacterium]